MPAIKRSVSGQPYPGLRSFEASEASLFHGRERQIEELLRRLSQNRFLAVVGSSGSGKSSVVRAGLLPALYRGYLAGATTRWRIAVMHPGSAPLSELARALAKPGVLGNVDVELLLERIDELDQIEAVGAEVFAQVGLLGDAVLGGGQHLGGAPTETSEVVVGHADLLYRVTRTDDTSAGW